MAQGALSMEPTIAVMDGKLFTYGATLDACKQAFRSQIIGAPPLAALDARPHHLPAGH